MQSIKFLSPSERRERGLFRESDNKFRCEYCELYFSRARDCVRHEKNYHKVRRIHSCTHCGEIFYNTSDLKIHAEKHIENVLSFKVYKKVFGGASVIFRKKIDDPKTQDPYELVNNPTLIKEIASICIHQAIIRRRMYFSMCSHCVFLKMDENGDILDKITFVANTKTVK